MSCCLTSATLLYTQQCYELKLLHVDAWYEWKSLITALTIHFVTYISRVLISQKYSPFIHIYCLGPCCLTYAIVMYITMLWMKFVACWCMIWMKLLSFCGVYIHKNLLTPFWYHNLPWKQRRIHFIDWCQKVSTQLV